MVRPHLARMDEHIRSVVPNAQFCEKVLTHLRDLGPQGTWLGSRTLDETTLEYDWLLEVCRILALHNIYQKTGKGPGLMKAPHHACHLAGSRILFSAWLLPG